MGRSRRVEFPGALYHVNSRGNAQQRIFDDDHDYHAFLAIVGRTVDRFQWTCYAYCLMGNHYHLVVQTPEGNLARGMRHLNGSYAQRFNLRNNRKGHVLQGPYGASLIESDGYLLESIRYVVLNPVRAGMCRVPEDWPWSSHRAMIAYEAPPPWLAANTVLELFAVRETRARALYRAFVDSLVPRDQVPSPG